MDTTLYTRQFTFDGRWRDLLQTLLESVNSGKGSVVLLTDRGIEIEVRCLIDIKDISENSKCELLKLLEGTVYCDRLDEGVFYANYIVKSITDNRYTFTFRGYMVSFDRAVNGEYFVVDFTENSEDVILNRMITVEEILIDNKGLGYLG